MVPTISPRRCNEWRTSNRTQNTSGLVDGERGDCTLVLAGGIEKLTLGINDCAPRRTPSDNKLLVGQSQRTVRRYLPGILKTVKSS